MCSTRRQSGAVHVQRIKYKSVNWCRFIPRVLTLAGDQSFDKFYWNPSPPSLSQSIPPVSVVWAAPPAFLSLAPAQSSVLASSLPSILWGCWLVIRISIVQFYLSPGTFWLNKSLSSPRPEVSVGRSSRWMWVWGEDDNFILKEYFMFDTWYLT